MSARKIALIGCGTFVAYGLLHKWHPLTFNWTEIPWLPKYNPNSRGKTNWPAFVVCGAAATAIVAKLDL